MNELKQFQISIEKSGRTFKCDSSTVLLQAGLGSGVALPYSCRSGVCSACRGQIRRGEVDYGLVNPRYLSEEDKARGYVLMCSARPLSDLVVAINEIDSLPVLPSAQMPVRVLKLEKLSDDVVALTLGLPANEPVNYKPGQYLNIALDEKTERSYSIANAPTTEGVRQLELHVRVIPGGVFSERLTSRLKVREMLKVKMPLGTFYLRENSSKPIVMVASGTGFAPIKAMIEYSINRIDPDATAAGLTPIYLYWGGRKKSDLYLYELCTEWAKKYEHIRFLPVLSEASTNCQWTGRTGFVHQAVMKDFPTMNEIVVYACGAPVMVEAAKHDFLKHCGLAEDAFYADSFVTEAEKNQAIACTI
jgi:CDP-4-dehydro-6-deoxyglucose reductase, E3